MLAQAHRLYGQSWRGPIIRWPLQQKRLLPGQSWYSSRRAAGLLSEEGATSCVRRPSPLAAAAAASPWPAPPGRSPGVKGGGMLLLSPATLEETTGPALGLATPSGAPRMIRSATARCAELLRCSSSPRRVVSPSPLGSFNLATARPTLNLLRQLNGTKQRKTGVSPRLTFAVHHRASLRSRGLDVPSDVPWKNVCVRTAS